MMDFTRIFVFCVVMAFMNGCIESPTISDDDDDTVEDNDDLSWVSMNDGFIRESTYQMDNGDEYRVNQSKLNDETNTWKRVFVGTNESAGDNLAQAFYHYEGGNELFRIGVKQRTDDGDEIRTDFYPLVTNLISNPEIGATWSSNYDFVVFHFVEENEVIGIEDINTSYAGYTEVLHIRTHVTAVRPNFDAVEVYFDSYYAKGIGLVKQTTSDDLVGLLVDNGFDDPSPTFFNYVLPAFELVDFIEREE